ncbi:MAG TPA: hypothetical protein PLX96_05645, partial [Candidatus Omnitrophota bacterium]|nr:hypothetical protein [Candidatus Omnitrophota bacterium]
MSDKTVKNKSIRFRITAAIVLVCFITTSVSSPVSANASPAGSAVLPPVSLSELTIPDELGTIVRSVGVQDGAAADPDKTNVRDSSRRTVILIQDAHAVNDAQDKIQKIIAHLQTHHYADMLLVEGAQGRLDPTILRNYPDENAKQRVVREYLERAELAGVESAAVLNDTLGHFEGAEDWALYSENFNAYHRAQAEKESLLDILSRHERKLETENTGRINSELQDFLKRWTGFRSGSVSFLDFLISLQEFSNLAKEEDGFSELKRILDALGYEKSSQSAELEPSVKKMASEFKRKFANVMDVRDQANFYMHYQKFLTGQSGAGEMLTCLLRLGRKLGQSPKLSPEMRLLLGHTQTLTGIKGNRLFEDLNRFLGMVAMSLAKDSDDVSAIRRYEELFVLEDLVKLELTHHSLFSLMKSEARGAKFETDSRSSDLRTSDKTGILNLDDFDLGFLPDLGLSVPDFEKKLQPALDFYRAALERDRVFYDRIKAAPESARAIVLIAGGFHTSGIERLLRENRDSYAVVTPRIGSLTGSENYLRVMNNDLSWQEYIGATYYDGLIRHAIRKLTEDLSESEFRQTAKRWRDNLIRDLASQNRITDFGQYSQYLGDLNRIYAERFAKDLKPLTKEDILGVIKRELEKFKSDVLVSLWKEVEDGPQGTTAGFSGLEERKEPSVTKPSDLAFDIPSSKPSMLSPALKLAPENLALTAPPRSEVRQQTVAARDVSEVLRRKLVLSPNAKVHEIGPGVGEPIEEGSGRIDWARKFKDVFKDKVTVFIHEPGAKRLAQTDTRLKDAKFSGKPFSAEDDSADVIIAMSVLSQPGVGDRGPVADAMARAVKVGGSLILGYYKGNPDEKARHEIYLNQIQEKLELSVVARGTDARHHWAIYRVDSKSRGAQKKGRSETRVNDVVKEKREDIRDGLRQSLRWLLAKMAVGPWRKQMLKLLLEDDRLDVKIAISSDGKDLFWIHQCFV